MAAKSAAAWKNEGATSFRQGRYRDAADAWTAAIESDDPTDNEFLAAVFANRCAARLKIGSEALRAPALKDAEDCLRLRPNWARGHARRGQVLMALGRSAEASVAFAKAVSLEPSNNEYSAAAKEAQEVAKHGFEEAAAAMGGNRTPHLAPFDISAMIMRWIGNAIGFVIEHQQNLMKGAFVLFGIWMLFGQGGGGSSSFGYGYDSGGFGGFDSNNFGYLVLVGGAIYFAHANGMSPFQ